MLTFHVTLRTVVTAGCAAVALAGCGGPGSTENAPVVVDFVDASQSTSAMRRPRGAYERGLVRVASLTAEHEGILFAAPADGNTVADAPWVIDGHTFSPRIGANQTLARAELREQARRLAPKVRQITRWRGRSGSDLLGALRNAARVFENYPDRPRALVLHTDGGVNVGGLNLLRRPPTTDGQLGRLVRRLKRQRLLADLTGGRGEPVKVWIGGLGRGVPRAPLVIRAFVGIVEAAGGIVVAEGSTLPPLVHFPSGPRP